MSFLFNQKFEPLSFDCNSEQSLSDIMTFDNGFAFSSSDYLTEGQYKIILSVTSGMDILIQPT